MAIKLGINITSLTAQRRLGEAQKISESAITRLSSGLRINSAADDAAGLALALKLGSDSRLFKQASRNISDGISYLSIADSAISSLKDITGRLSELAEQAANGIYTTAQRSALDDEAQAPVSEYNRIVNTTSFNGIKLLDGSSTGTELQVGIGGTANDRISIGLASVLSTSGGGHIADGTFSAAGTFTAPTDASNYIGNADFNGDGYLDLAVLEGNSNPVVYLNQGNGTFGNATTFSIGGFGQGLYVGDANGDGNADLIVGERFSHTVNFFRGNGNGTFAANLSSDVNVTQSDNFTFGDLNNDGRIDVVSIGTSGAGENAQVALQNLDGTFTLQAAFDGGGDLYNNTITIIADIDNDGYGDVFAATGGQIKVYKGNGSGGMTLTDSLFGYGNIESLVAGDFNNDGVTDVAAGYVTGINIFLMNANGTDSSVLGNSLGGIATVAQDFNNDGNVDLVALSSGSNNAVIGLGNGNGTFAASTTISINDPRGATAIDFDNDGVTDIAVSARSTGRVQLLLGNFTTALTIDSIDLSTQDAARTSLGYISTFNDLLSLRQAQVAGSLSRLNAAYNFNSVMSENPQAAYSRIFDADIAEETAKLVRSQILTQAASAILAQANQEPALVLQLLS